MHDLIHGFGNVDNEFFFTIKKLLTKPGHSISDFVTGKRVGYFSFVTRLVIILGVLYFVNEFAQVDETEKPYE